MERQKHARSGLEQAETDLVFATRAGKSLSAGNVRRDFRKVVDRAGLAELIGKDWTPREMRNTFVSVLSDNEMPVSQIALLVGHRGGSAVTERVYRHQIRPVITKGAEAMDAIFGPLPGAENHRGTPEETDKQ
jgi:site-specific recombinase XerD